MLVRCYRYFASKGALEIRVIAGKFMGLQFRRDEIFVERMIHLYSSSVGAT